MLARLQQSEILARRIDPGMGEGAGVERFVAALADQDFDSAGIEDGRRRALDDTDARAQIIGAGPGIVSRYSWQAQADRFVDNMASMASR
jgi:hypothetical protein